MKDINHIHLAQMRRLSLRGAGALLHALWSLLTRAIRAIRGPAQARKGAGPRAGGLGLVERQTRLRDSEQVKRYLPDILGRALARIWIDPLFRQEFARDPLATMARHNVFLPERMEVEFQAGGGGSARPRIAVFERGAFGLRKEVLHLQLVMKASL